MRVRLQRRRPWYNVLGVVALLSTVQVSSIFAQPGAFPGAPPRFQPPQFRANIDACRARSDDADADKRITACSALIDSRRLPPRELALAYRSRALGWKQKKDLDRTIADLDQAIRIAPRNPELLLERGIVYRQKGEFDRAITDYDQALRVDPGFANAYNARGFAFREKGDLDRAIADYDRAISLNPRYSLAINNRGTAWRAKGDVARAIADFSVAIRVDPSAPLGYLNRGLAYESMGERARARADFSTAVTLTPRGERAERVQQTARARLALLDTEKEVAPERSSPPVPATLPVRPAAPAASPPPAVAPSPSPRLVTPPPSVAPAPAPQLATPSPSVAPAAAPPPAKSLTDPGRRVALVIGNGAYVSAGSLANPPNDARSVAGALREIGFDVSEGTDLDRLAQEGLVRDFLRKAASARIALLFYAGHGLQVDGKNYLVPVDAKLADATDLGFETLELDKIVAGLEDETRTNIVILDACRDNPLARSFAGKLGASRSTAVSEGLAAVSTVGAGTLIAFATAPGKTALDGAGGNSPFTAALVKHIRTPGLEVRQMLTRVRAEVAAGTHNKQIPWDNSSLLGEVFLAGGPKQ